MSETAEVYLPAGSSEAPAEAAVHSFEFTGNAGEYFRIWIVNVFLSILTLGIYSAWAKVRNKQYFYRHTWVDGASFEYHGDPRKILKGRIIVVAAIVLLAVLQQHSAVLYAFTIVAVVLASPWVLVRALAFNARNSSWRNVRFSFGGTTKGAAIAYLKGLAAYIGMLGLGFPLLQWFVTRFAVDHHAFGKLPFRFHATAKDFFLVYLGAALFLAIPIALLVAAATAVSEGGQVLVALAVLIAYVGYFAAYVFIKARLANLVWSGIAIGEHRLASAQLFKDVLLLEFTNILAIACTLGLAVPWARVRNHRYRLQRLALHAAGPLIVETDPAQAKDGALGDAASDLGDFDLGFG